MAQKDLLAFGQAVRQHRHARHLSQEALAEQSELHRTYISGIERGERNVGLINVFRLARALHITTAQLFETAETLGRRSRQTTR